MIYQGNSLSVQLLEAGIVDINLDANGSVNKFDQATLQEFIAAIKAINNCAEARAVMVTSAKPAFLVGADINEFLDIFKKPETELLSWIKAATDIFDSFEDINLPTIAGV